MEALETLIIRQLHDDTVLQPLLAKWRNRPAVMLIQIPHEQDAGWEGGAEDQYPRMGFIINRREDPARRTSGLAVFEVHALRRKAGDFKAITDRLKEVLNESAWRTDEGVYGLRLAAAEMVQSEDDENEDFLVMQIVFDLLLFTSQESYEPDPIETLNTWTKYEFPALQVNPLTWTPSDESPAVYWRLATLGEGEKWPLMTMMNVQAFAHIHAPTPTVRLFWARKIVEKIGIVRQLYMPPDERVLWLVNAGLTTSNDPLRMGQVMVDMEYAVYVHIHAGPPVTEVVVSTESWS